MTVMRTAAQNSSATAVIYGAAPVAAGLLSAFVLWQSYQIAWSFNVRELRETARQTLAVYVSSLTGMLDRYRALPELFAREQAVRQVLATPDDPAVVAGSNAILKLLNETVGALDVYVIDRTGLTVAASNAGEPMTFLGHNYAFRPYFRQAMAGGSGRYFAVGATSGKRGYFFSAPVRVDGGIAGVVNVKVDLARIEADWNASEHQSAYVTDEFGVVILSSNPEWLFRTTRPLTEAEHARIAEERKYADRTPEPLPTRMDRWVATSATVPDHEFTLHLLTAKATIQRQVWNVVLSTLLAQLVLAVLVGGLWLWRRHHKRELDYQTRLNNELEIRVAERTARLQEMNVSLQHEIVERRRAETSLHKAQDELVHAGKLAALGTMSASISHELNQPLGAINSFAANARQLLGRGRLDEAAGTLGLIAEAAERAARIVANLRAFVRRERKAPVVIDLVSAVDAAIAEARPLLTSHGIKVVCDLPDSIAVRGGETRVNQVLANIVANAALAMVDAPRRILRVGVELRQDTAALVLADTGPGMSPDALARAKEPFFTTRAHAEGLGLGLAICEDIMRSLDGSITIANGNDGGAVVTLVFARVIEAMA